MRVLYKGRTLLYTHFMIRPGAEPAEDEKTPDVRMDALIAASAARPQAEPLFAQGHG